MEEFGKFIGSTIGGLIYITLVLCGGAFLFALPVKLLWNWVAVDMFHFPVIDFWHAFGLFLLCGLLLKGHHVQEK